jgi:hypothetical protein
VDPLESVYLHVSDLGDDRRAGIQQLLFGRARLVIWRQGDPYSVLDIY